MKTTDTNRVNMLTATLGVLAKNKSTWQAHVAFSEGVDAVTALVEQVEAQAQIAQGNSGAASAKKLALRDLAVAVSEVIGAVRSYAAKNAVPELAAKVDFSPSSVVAGKAQEVVTRCRTIHAAANAIVADLADYGITATKLTALKKKIDAFDGVKTSPRQSLVERKAANELLPQLVRSAVETLRQQLDGLVIQFRESSPNFFEEYFAARVVVDSPGSQTDTDVQPVTPSPAPQPA